MSELTSTKYPNNIRTVAGNVFVFPDDSVLLCDTSLGPVTINLLGIQVNYWSTQYKLYVVDKSGNASVNNITINAGFGEDPTTNLPVPQLINASANQVINVNNGGCIVRILQNYTYTANNNVFAGAAGGSGYNLIKDENVALPARTTINFVGAGVTASDVAGQTQVNITGGIISLTNAQMLTLISTSAVIPGQLYLITDAGFTDGGVIVQGSEINSTTTVQGSGLFLNADYQSVGDYSGVVGFAAALGLWSTDVQPVVIGDCVVYDNLNYKNLTGNWGTAPSTDVINWSLLSKSRTNGYIREIDFVKYNVFANTILYRADARLNEVEFSNSVPEALVLFQWGRNKTKQNKISNGAYMNCTNSNCQITGNVISNLSFIQDSSPKIEAGLIRYNIVSNKAYIRLFQTKGSVSYNTLDGDKTNIAYDVPGTVKLVNLQAVIEYNYLKNGGFITFDNMSGNSKYVNNNIELGGFEIATQLGGSIEQNNMFGVNIVVGNVTLTGGIKDINCQPNLAAINIPTLNTIITGDIRRDFSNFTATLDFADATIWNGTDLTIPALYSYIGRFTILGANPATPIVKIINMPINHPCTFQPENAQQCGFQHTLVGVSVANDLLCDAPASLNIISGRTNGTDFIEYKASGTKNIRTNLVLLA